MKSEDWSNRMIEFKEYITIMDYLRLVLKTKMN